MNLSGRSVHCVLKSLVVLLLLSSSATFAQAPQERVHEMSHSVMPFDMSKTIHVFKMTE